MEIYTNPGSTRPLALPSDCVWVSAYLPTLATIAAAEAQLGLAARWREEQASGTTLSQVHATRLQVQGTNGFAVKVSAKGMDPDGGVRGKPPRGWPV